MIFFRTLLDMLADVHKRRYKEKKGLQNHSVCGTDIEKEEKNETKK